MKLPGASPAAKRSVIRMAAAKPGTYFQERGQRPPTRPPDRPPRQGSGGGAEEGRSRLRRYPLPQDVRQEDRLDWRQCGNLALALQRYLPYHSDAEGETWELTKQEIGPEVIKLGNRLLRQPPPWLADFVQRQQALRETLAAVPGLALWSCRARTSSRLSVGFGNTTPLETGITLHRLTGLPYLPGSALKGLCRAWALSFLADKYQIPRLLPEEIALLQEHKPKLATPWELFEDLLCTPADARKQASERLANWQQRLRQERLLARCGTLPILAGSLDLQALWQDPDRRAFVRIFGSQDQRGAVCFYDAFPNALTEMLALDIINVHYQPYYSDPAKNPPADYYSPVPNYFLTVTPGVSFQVVLTSWEAALVQTAGAWLTAGLQQLGVGAKTAVGYGVMAVS